MNLPLDATSVRSQQNLLEVIPVTLGHTSGRHENVATVRVRPSHRRRERAGFIRSSAEVQDVVNPRCSGQRREHRAVRVVYPAGRSLGLDLPSLGELIAGGEQRQLWFTVDANHAPARCRDDANLVRTHQRPGGHEGLPYLDIEPDGSNPLAGVHLGVDRDDAPVHSAILGWDHGIRAGGKRCAGGDVRALSGLDGGVPGASHGRTRPRRTYQCEHARTVLTAHRVPVHD